MLPSMNSTIECTMDWGCSKTSIASPSISNRKAASIISSPLLNIVAESSEIFFPIFQIGWFNACSGPACSISSSVLFLNGPPDAVSMSFFRSLRLPAIRH